MTEGKKSLVDRFYVDKKDFDDFNRLKQKDSPFAGAQNKEVFLAAMVLGFYEGCKIGIKKKTGYFRESYLNDKERTLIRSIAVADAGRLNVLLDKPKVRSIAEQYATGGIAILKSRIFHGEYGSYAKKLESELLRAYEKIRKLPEVTKTVKELNSMSVSELVKNDESETLEFKSSLIWDTRKKQPNKELKIIIARTVASFMNVNGGVLLIGVDDDKTVRGLKDDLAQYHNSHDEYVQSLIGTIHTYLGKANGPYVKMSFEPYEDKEIAILHVKKSPHPVYLRVPNRKEEFCIRSGNTCTCLEVSEANMYIKDHWPNL